MATKSIKFKIGNGYTLAAPTAPLGMTPSGAIIFQVDNIPESVTNTQARLKVVGAISPWKRVYRFDWSD